MKIKLVIAVLIIALFAFLASAYTITEGQKGILLRFDSVIKDNENKAVIYEPGLHFKIPVLDKVKILDARIQTMDDKAARFVTSEKKDVMIDSYVKWRILDFNKYYLATSGANLDNAENLLRRKVADSLRAQIGTKQIKEIVSEKREEIMKTVLNDAQKNSIDLGIQVIDVRVKKINLPDEINKSIYERMRAERETAAKTHRSQGIEEAEKIKAQADLDVATILADADKKARITRGNADATVAKLYADAYSLDPEFYSFTRSLEAYATSFNNKNDLLVVDPSSAFFHYMKKSK